MIRTDLDLTDETFLHKATMYVTDEEIDAGFAMLTDAELTLERVAAPYGARHLVDLPPKLGPAAS